MSRARESAAERLAVAFDLTEMGIQMLRQNLRRRYPKASAKKIGELIEAWMAERPGAELGDAEGRPVPWPPPR